MIHQLLWLLIPAMVSNMAPIFAARYKLLQSLSGPADGGHTWHGQRLLGDHKTIRGFIVGPIAGAATAAVQSVLPTSLNSGTPLQTITGAITFGFILGLAALLGDALKSFFKRRLNIRPGRTWPVFDQTDFVIVSLITLGFFHPVPVLDAMLIVIIIGVASLLTSALGVLLNIKMSL